MPTTQDEAWRRTDYRHINWQSAGQLSANGGGAGFEDIPASSREPLLGEDQGAMVAFVNDRLVHREMSPALAEQGVMVGATGVTCARAGTALAASTAVAANVSRRNVDTKLLPASGPARGAARAGDSRSQYWNLDGHGQASAGFVLPRRPPGQSALIEVDFDVAIAQLAANERLGQRILDVTLDRTPQRSGAVRAVEAGRLDDPVDGVGQSDGGSGRRRAGPQSAAGRRRRAVRRQSARRCD